MTAVDDQAGDLPLWCPSCGATLRKAPEEREPHEDIEHFVMQLRTASADVPPRHAVLMAVAVVCGLLAAVYTYGIATPPGEPVPGRRIFREGYSIQPPDQDWRFHESRWRSERCDLALEATNRGSQGAVFVVNVVRPQHSDLTLDELLAQTRRQWTDPHDDWTILEGQGGSTTVANQPAVRIVAVSSPYPAGASDRRQYERVRREAVVLVHRGVGYRLTAEQLDTSFEHIRSRFNKLVTSFECTSDAETSDLR